MILIITFPSHIIMPHFWIALLMHINHKLHRYIALILSCSLSLRTCQRHVARIIDTSKTVINSSTRFKIFVRVRLYTPTWKLSPFIFREKPAWIKHREKTYSLNGRFMGPRSKKIIDEYIISISVGTCSRDRFLNFLEDKLEIDGYWKKVGLA